MFLQDHMKSLLTREERCVMSALIREGEKKCSCERGKDVCSYTGG